jgi:signal transduction histidine kinase
MTVSLRRRLIGSLLALTLLAWMGSALFTGAYANRVLLDQVDRQLTQYMDLVGYISQVFARQVDEGHPAREPWLQQMFERSDHPVIVTGPMESQFAPALNIWLGNELIAVLEHSPRFNKPTTEGFAERNEASDGSHWRTLARFDRANGLTILVGIELDAARWDMLATFARAAFPLLIILPLTVALLYFGVTRGLRPVKELAQQISQRSPNALEPVVAAQVPAEIEPVVAELNELLERLATALDSEQRFTANAAHELVTPLAAIKTEVQLCQRQIADEAGAAMLQRITARVDRASHTVEQLLTLARLDPAAPLVQDCVALDGVLRDVLAELAHLAVERDLTLELNIAEDVHVQGQVEALAIMLRNLVINALRYAEGGSEVRILLAESEQGVALEICNACTPLSSDEFARIGDRFYRVPGSAGLGAGLGLSIVERIVAHHCASWRVGPGEDGSGFCARVTFPHAVTN